MHPAGKGRMFPVGLYGLLLLALSGLAFPGIFDPLEKLCRTLVCLPLRAYSVVIGAQPAMAAERPRAAAGSAQMRAVLQRHAADARGLVPQALPLVCQVRGQLRNRQGHIHELVLAQSSGQLRGIRHFVTFGRSLVGFLRLDPEDAAPARVRLLNWRPARRSSAAGPAAPGAPPQPARIAAELRCQERGVEGLLRFLVEPSRSVDRWPLRCSLLDDPYLASRLRRSGGRVRTSRTLDPTAPPPGLELGRLQIWGYPKLDIPVGLFVAPLRPAAELAVVCLWVPGGQRMPTVSLEPAGDFLPVQLTRYPAPRPALQRWLLTCTAGLELPDAAALSQDGWLLGILQRPWSGQSLVTPLGNSNKPLNLLLWDGGERLDSLVGRFVGVAADGRLRLRLPAPGRLFAGRLYTGCNGWHGPMGLCLGEAVVEDEDHLLLRLPSFEPRDARVFVGEGVLPR